MSQTARTVVRRRLVPVAGAVIGMAGVAFVVRTLVTRREEVGDALSGAEPAPLLFSLLLGLGAMSSIGWVWAQMLRDRGHEAPGRRAMAWYFVGQLGKYVPGGIWPIVGRAELAVRGGVERGAAYRATGLSLVTTYAAAVVAVAAGSLLSWDKPVVGSAAVLCLVAAVAALGSPSVSGRVSGLATRLSGRGLVLPRRADFVRLTALHVPAWVLMSLSTSVTASALGADISVTKMLFVASASWLAGFLVPGVPGGIGVRESVFTALAGPMVGTPVAVSLALVSRVVFVCVDLAGAAVSTAVAGSAGRRDAA
ncbi:MAG: lysylphosphatidylglycerol synthase domain-containing protein [Actinomycetota bacterium]